MPGTVLPLQQLFVIGTVIPIIQTHWGHAVASGHATRVVVPELEAMVVRL